MYKKLLFLIISILGFAGVSNAQGEVQENSSGVIQSIRITGNKSIPEQEIVDTLPIRAGSPYEPKQQRAVRELVLSIYRSQGFMNSSVSTSVDVAVSSTVFTIAIEEGPLFHFGQTTITGLDTLPEKVVRNNLTFKPGDVFKKRELFNTQGNLYRSGFFEQVTIVTSTTAAKLADVSIAVKQQPTRWLKTGVGWGSEEQERLSLTLTHKNLGGRAYRGELFGTVSHIWQEYKADFVNPYFFDKPIEERVSGSWRKENREGYEIKRALAEISFAKNLSHKIKATWVPYQIKQTRTKNATPEIAATTPEHADGRAMSLSFNRDNANDLFFPSRGTRTNLVLQRSGGVFGGNIDFNKASVETRWYHAVWPPVIVAVSGRVGVIKQFSPSQEVPIFERFFTGGGNSVRGYRERGVGPKDITNAPLGGNWISGGNLELRFPLFWKFSGAVFLDGGQVGDRFSNVETSEWKWATGGGIRLKTPVGPIRLDYGHKLNPASDDVDHWRLHFSLGESF